MNPGEGKVLPPREVVAAWETELNKRVRESDIPFLGLHEALFSDEIREGVAALVLNQRSVSAYVRYLHLSPTLFAINLTRAVMRGFGADGYFSVWPAVEDMLGVPGTSASDREQLWKAFRQACVMLGLEVSPRTYGTHYMVDEFLRHVGVPLQQVDHLAEKMLVFAGRVGVADDCDPNSVRLWRDALLERLKLPFPATAAAAVALDEDGYYVRLFSRLYLERPDETTVESEFERQLLRAIQRQALGRHRGRAMAIPQLLLRETVLGVALPAGEATQWTIEADAQSWSYLGGVEAKFVPLQQPLARKVVVYEDRTDLTRSYELWAQGHNNEYLVFEKGSGRYVRPASLELAEISVAPGVYTLLLRFAPDEWQDEVPCVSEDPSLYVTNIALRPGATQSLRRGPAQTSIRAEPRAAITWSGAAISTNEGTEIYPIRDLMATVSVPAELRSDVHSVFELHIYPESLGRKCEEVVALDSEGSAAKALSEIAAGNQWSAGLSRVLVELHRQGQKRALVRSSVLVWNGLTGFDARQAAFTCTTPPANLDLQACINVSVRDMRRRITFRDDSQRFFRLVFSQAQGASLVVSRNVPGILMFLETSGPDGTVSERALRPGAKVVVGPVTRNQLRIFADQRAWLSAGNWRRLVEFPRLGSIRLSLGGLADQINTSANTLHYEAEESAVGPLALLQLVYPHQAWEFAVRHTEGALEVAFTSGQQIDGIRVHALELLSGREFTLTVIPNHPADNSVAIRNVMLFADAAAGGTQYELSMPTHEIPRGAWLLRLESRQSNNWGPLCNERQDRYAVGALIGAGGALTGRLDLMASVGSLSTELCIAVLARVHRVLMECYAEESWETITWTKELWTQLLPRSRSEVENAARMLVEVCAMGPGDDASSSWIPMVNLIARVPGVLALPYRHYRTANPHAGAIAAALRVLPRFADEALGTLRESCHPVTCMAFRNAAHIERTAATPQGFSLPQFRQACRLTDLPERHLVLHREDWHPGPGEWLGPLHYRHARRALEKRYDRSLDGNEQRRGESLFYARQLAMRAHQINLLGLSAGIVPGMDELVLGLPEDGAAGLGDGAEQRRSNLLALERVIATFALLCRWEARTPGALEQFPRLLNATTAEAEGAMGYLLFIAEELLAFYLMLWELAILVEHDNLE